MSDFDVIRNNFCSDLNLSSKLVDKERCLMSAPLTDAIRSTSNTCRLGVLVTMVDVAASDPVLAAWSPDWTATQDLSVYTSGPLLVGPVVVDARLLRLGKKVISVAADIYDGHGIEDLDTLRTYIDDPASSSSGPALAAKSLVTFTRISRTSATGVDSYDPNQWVGKLRTRTSGRHNSEALNDRVGIRVCDAGAGIVEVANKPYISNSIGTINGGVQAVVVEAAAEAMRPGMIASDIQIHYLSQLKVGPARTVGTIVRDAADHSVIMIQLLDAGAGDKILTSATLTLQRLP